jgi:hypothetical protein
MRTFDLHLQRVAQVSGAADMVDMAVRQPDLFDGHAGLLDRFQNLGHVPAGVDHHGLLGRLVPDDGAVLLEQRYRHDHRAGFRLGLGFVIHAWHHIPP